MRLLPRSALNRTLNIVAGMLDVGGCWMLWIDVIIKFVISDSNTFEANMPSCLYSITWYYSENVTEEVGPLSWLTHAGSSTQVFIGHSLSTCMCCMHCGNARPASHIYFTTSRCCFVNAIAYATFCLIFCINFTLHTRCYSYLLRTNIST